MDQQDFLTIAQVVEENRRTGRGHDAHGNPVPFSPREFFDISLALGLCQSNPAYRALHENLASWIHRHVPGRTAIEIGAGPGYLTVCLNRLGVRALAVDGNEFSREYFRRTHPEYSTQYILDPLFERPYEPADLVLSIEAFEHIPDDGLARIFGRVREEIRPRHFVFSSTPHRDPNPGWDEQWGHINLKTPAQWHELFAAYGYRPSPLHPPVTEWASLYVRTP